MIHLPVSTQSANHSQTVVLQVSRRNHWKNYFFLLTIVALSLLIIVFYSISSTFQNLKDAPQGLHTVSENFTKKYGNNMQEDNSHFQDSSLQLDQLINITNQLVPVLEIPASLMAPFFVSACYLYENTTSAYALFILGAVRLNLMDLPDMQAEWNQTQEGSASNCRLSCFLTRDVSDEEYAYGCEGIVNKIDTSDNSNGPISHVHLRDMVTQDIIAHTVPVTFLVAPARTHDTSHDVRLSACVAPLDFEGMLMRLKPEQKTP